MVVPIVELELPLCIRVVTVLVVSVRVIDGAFASDKTMSSALTVPVTFRLPLGILTFCALSTDKPIVPVVSNVRTSGVDP